jgi:hypothetical protein
MRLVQSFDTKFPLGRQEEQVTSRASYRLSAGMWAERKDIPDLAPVSLRCSCWKLENGMRRETNRDAPWPDIPNHFAYAAPAIEVNKIDGEPHAKGVNAFAGQNPKALSGQ